MINVPWLFNTVWWVIKGWLAAKTVEKITVLGSGYLDELSLDFLIDDLPVEIGGCYSKPVEPFVFATKEPGEMLS